MSFCAPESTLINGSSSRVSLSSLLAGISSVAVALSSVDMGVVDCYSVGHFTPQARLKERSADHIKRTHFRISTFFAYSLELPENLAYSLHISQIHEADFVLTSDSYVRLSTHFRCSSFFNCTHFDARLSLFNFRCIMYSLQIHKQAIVLTPEGNQNVPTRTSECDCPALINFKHIIFRPCPQSMAGIASLAAAPGGAAAAAAAPSAGSVPPPLGAPLPGGGPDGARPSNGRETEPAEANEPHTRHAGAVDARPLHSSDTFVTSS